MKIRKMRLRGEWRWVVDAGVKDGRRRRFLFRTPALARAKMKELERDQLRIGRAWADISAADRAVVVRVLEEMRGRGVTLAAVWLAYQRGDGRGKAATDISLVRAIEECVRFKREANCRPIYVESLESYLTQFARGRGELRVGEVTLPMIDEWLGAQPNASSRQTWRNRLSSFFAFCVRRGYAIENLVRRTETVKVDYDRPGVLSLRSARRLMRAAEAIDPELCPGLALKLFAGVRPQEAARLTWQQVHLDRREVLIEAAAAKKREVRIAQLPENAVRWLELAGEDERQGRPVLPRTNLRRRMAAVRARAGIQEWPHDVLRHTAASHWYELHGAVVTARQMGHSERVLFTHYRALVTRRAAEWFFKIKPRRTAAKRG